MNKKFLSLPFILLSVLLAGCNSSSAEESKPSFTLPNEAWREEFNDSKNSFNDAASLTSAKQVINNQEVIEYVVPEVKTDDYKFELYNQTHLRYVDLSNGYAISLPKEKVTSIDRSLGALNTKFIGSDCSYRISMEDPKPYTTDSRGYQTFMDEWTFPYLRNPNYYKDNNMVEYASHLIEDTSLVEGYSITAYFIQINGLVSLGKSFYHIACVREARKYNKFIIILYKSAHQDAEFFKESLKSIKMFSSFGKSKNYVGQAEKIYNPKWSEETKKYYEKLCNQRVPDFGFFCESMNNADSDNRDSLKRTIMSMTNDLETAFDTKFMIIPTYSHLCWENIDHHFSDLAFDLAGGNGFNKRPVLQYTYQYTTNNNNVTFSKDSNLPLPILDIFRGKYDRKFHELARAIKQYSKPVLFRLNNEMNTDWTSYCGLYNLLDPELFTASWRYLYDIFDIEGVNNCIWIWNPFDVDGPRGNWCNFLNYYPGDNYVQMLGETSYEFNNGAVGANTAKPFKNRYGDLYELNNDYFMNLPAIVGEFACGAGGQEDGELGRNQKSQANWVESMFKEISREKDYCKNIKAYVWFNKNDVANGIVTNYLKITQELTETRAAFKEGFALLKQMEEGE